MELFINDDWWASEHPLFLFFVHCKHTCVSLLLHCMQNYYIRKKKQITAHHIWLYIVLLSCRQHSVLIITCITICPLVWLPDYTLLVLCQLSKYSYDQSDLQDEMVLVLVAKSRLVNCGLRLQSQRWYKQQYTWYYNYYYEVWNLHFMNLNLNQGL